MKRNFPGIEVDHAGCKPVLQSLFLKIGERVGFSLAVIPADAEVGGEIGHGGRNPLVKGANQLIFTGGEQPDCKWIEYPFP
jgi:hypothetical protein